MKISEVTVGYAAEYLKIDADEEATTLNLVLAAAKAYIIGQTGLDSTTIDNHEDLTIAFMVLVAEIYDTRQFTVQNDKENPVVKNILAMHSKNLIA